MSVNPDSLNKPEPMPEPSSHPAAWDLVKADIAERDAAGEKKYGHRLTPFNGRKPLVDLYQELLDAVVYCRQALYEIAEKDKRIEYLEEQFRQAAYFGGHADTRRAKAEFDLVEKDAHINRLRQTLEHFSKRHNCDWADEALAAVPAQSLAEHDAAILSTYLNATGWTGRPHWLEDAILECIGKGGGCDREDLCNEHLAMAIKTDEGIGFSLAQHDAEVRRQEKDLILAKLEGLSPWFDVQRFRALLESE